MLTEVSNLIGSALRATDGDIGTVEDFYFDDEHWTVRYLVADTAKWLPGRKVLIPPKSLGGIKSDAKKIEIKLTREQIKNSPDVDTHKPISRQNEANLYDYYGYPYYWPAPTFAGPVTFPVGLPEGKPIAAESEAREIEAAKQRESLDERHLRSTGEVTSYYIHASDGEIGHVEDLLVEDMSWTIRYIVVDTKNWWPGKKVLVSPRWAKEVRWDESSVFVDLTRESIKSGPEYDSSVSLDRNYEERLHKHHGRQQYWVP